LHHLNDQFRKLLYGLYFILKPNRPWDKDELLSP
jgi:hypothetical protein